MVLYIPGNCYKTVSPALQISSNFRATQGIVWTLVQNYHCNLTVTYITRWDLHLTIAKIYMLIINGMNECVQLTYHMLYICRESWFGSYLCSACFWLYVWSLLRESQAHKLKWWKNMLMPLFKVCKCIVCIQS